jgi:hypothetical protein
MPKNKTKDWGLRELFESIRDEPRLRWIDRNLQLTVDGRTLIGEYDWVMSWVRKIELMTHASILFIWGCVIAGNVALWKYYCIGLFSGIVLGLITALSVIAAGYFNHFVSNAIDDYIHLWVEKHWTYQNLRELIDDLVIGAGGGGAYGAVRLAYIMATPAEATTGGIPVKVKQDCIRYLEDLGDRVSDLPRNDPQGDTFRRQLKKLLLTYKRFRVVHPSVSASSFYPIK